MATPDPINKEDPENVIATPPGGRTICEIRRHPVGVLGIYGMTGLLLVIIAFIAFGLVPAITSSTAVKDIGIIILFLLSAVCVVYSFIFTKIYWDNVWVLTTDSIHQITQTGIFRRSSSILPLDGIENITAEQESLLALRLDYGQLSVEVGGGSEKYTFTYCPHPDYYVQQIRAAQEIHKQQSEAQVPEDFLSQPPPLVLPDAGSEPTPAGISKSEDV